MMRDLLTRTTLRRVYRLWWEHRYGVGPKDVFLVSYPRSGNTWVRFMLLQARPEFREPDFKRIEEIIPDMHGPRAWFLSARTNLVKSHLCHWQPFRRVVYLVRDGRAATWSNWRYQLDEGVFQGSFAEFLSSHTWPSTWGQHVSGWVGERETRLVVRYEDLVANPVGELEKITTLLGWACPRERLARIAAASTREMMKTMEDREHIRLHRVGTGKRSWREDFSPELEQSFLDGLPPAAMPFLVPCVS